MDTYSPDFTVITNAFQGIKILGSSGVLALIISLLGCVIVTRDVEKWKVLWFPMLLTTSFIGIPLGGLGTVCLYLSVLLMASEILSTQVIGNIISGIKTGTQAGGSRLGRVMRGISGGALSISRKGSERVKGWQSYTNKLAQQMKEKGIQTKWTEGRKKEGIYPRGTAISDVLAVSESKRNRFQNDNEEQRKKLRKMEKNYEVTRQRTMTIKKKTKKMKEWVPYLKGSKYATREQWLEENKQ